MKKVSFEEGLRVRGYLALQIHPTAKLRIGKFFKAAGGMMINPLGRNIKSVFRIDKNAFITIGDNVGMSNVSLWAKESIEIGDNVKLGAGVIIMDSDMHSLDYIQRREVETDSLNTKSKGIVIGNDAFIGVNSIITKGVSVGERSIVGAGSVVAKSIPSDQIWGGNPAIFIKKNK